MEAEKNFYTFYFRISFCLTFAFIIQFNEISVMVLFSMHSNIHESFGLSRKKHSLPLNPTYSNATISL